MEVIYPKKSCKSSNEDILNSISGISWEDSQKQRINVIGGTIPFLFYFGFIFMNFSFKLYLFLFSIFFLYYFFIFVKHFFILFLN